MIFLGRFDNALQFLRAFGPDERPGVLVVVSNVAQQEFFQLAFRFVHTLRQALLAQDAEETFHHVDPGSMGGSVVEVYAGIALQPALRGRVFVDIEVVEHHVQFSPGESLDHLVQKAQKVDRGAALFDVGHNLSACDLQSRKQGLSAVTDIFIGPTAGFLCAQGQQWLGRSNA